MPDTHQPPQSHDATANEAQLRAALKWETGQSAPADKNAFVWLWEAVQGDFNDERSTGQIAFDAGISMIPLVDQVCDIRDLIANCKGIAQSKPEEDNTWKWVALALTLIGLFPSLGSLLKGVLKICFLYVRKLGASHVAKAIEICMHTVITFLRKREVSKYWSRLNIDEVCHWLAQNVHKLKAQITTSKLISAMDEGSRVLKGMQAKVEWIPKVGERVKKTVAMVEDVRRKADGQLQKALGPVQEILDKFALRLEREAVVARRGIINVRNVHFRGALPQNEAVTLMQRYKPKWLTEGTNLKYSQLKRKDEKLSKLLADKEAQGWPKLTDDNIISFHKIAADKIEGPARLYRIVSPSNGAMGDCWVSEEVFKKIMESSDQKATWRKYLAVWPDWNANGQFVFLEIAEGESLKVWRGPASSQVKKLDNFDYQLEGGWEQVIIKDTSIVKKEGVPEVKLVSDTFLSYRKDPATGELSQLSKTRTRCSISF